MGKGAPDPERTPTRQADSQALPATHLTPSLPTAGKQDHKGTCHRWEWAFMPSASVFLGHGCTCLQRMIWVLLGNKLSLIIMDSNLSSSKQRPEEKTSKESRVWLRVRGGSFRRVGTPHYLFCQFSWSVSSFSCELC